MNSVPLRDFQLKPTAYLNSLPVCLTRYGRVVAEVYAPGQFKSAVELPTNSLPEKKLENFIQKVASEKKFDLCPHGRALGLCEKGCK